MTAVAAPAFCRAPRGVGAEDLDGALWAIFEWAFEMLQDGRPAVLVVAEDDLLGHGDPADAAAATAVVGLVRALATEGRRDGWRINALSVPLAEMDRDWYGWACSVNNPGFVNGALVRLGTLHLGRVPL